MIATSHHYVLVTCVAAVLFTSTLVKFDTQVSLEAPATLDADAILAASVAAQGGKERIERIDEIMMTGTVVYPGSDMRASMTHWQEAPDRMHVTFTWSHGVDYHLDVRGGVVTIDQGVVGGIRDRQTVQGRPRGLALEAAQFTEPATYKYLGITVFEGTLAYQLTRSTATASSTHYISVATLLPVGEETAYDEIRPEWEPAGSHAGRQRTSFSDFRRVDGVLMPFCLKRAATADRPANTTFIDSITTNAARR